MVLCGAVLAGTTVAIPAWAGGLAQARPRFALSGAFSLLCCLIVVALVVIVVAVVVRAGRRRGPRG